MTKHRHSPKARVGEAHGAARLTEARVRRLRERARRESPASGWIELAALKLGVSPSAITMAIHGATWAHLPGAVTRDLRITGGPRSRRRSVSR